jgi:hypothetical protein
MSSGRSLRAPLVLPSADCFFFHPQSPQFKKGTWGEYVEKGYERKTKATGKLAAVNKDEKGTGVTLHRAVLLSFSANWQE